MTKEQIRRKIERSDRRVKRYETPHRDKSGPSREVLIATILAGKDSGRIVMHFTPDEEKEYNRGMAIMAEMG